MAKQRVNKKLQGKSFTKNVRKPKIYINSLRMSRQLDIGYVIEFDGIINENIAKCVGVLDVQGLKTGKAKVRIVTPEKERTPDYFSTHNIWELAIFQKDAPLFYQVVRAWYDEVEQLVADNKFGDGTGALVKPVRQEPTKIGDILKELVWVSRDGHDVQTILDKLGVVSEEELTPEPEVKLPLWVWGYINTRPLHQALAEVYFDKDFEDIRGELYHALLMYNRAKYGEEPERYITLDTFVAKAYIEDWGYVAEDYYICPLPGLQGYYLYLNEETGALEPVYKQEPEEEELLIPGSILPQEYLETAELIIDGSDNVDSVVDIILGEWNDRYSYKLYSLHDETINKEDLS